MLPSWSPFGALLGPLGALLEPSRAPNRLQEGPTRVPRRLQDGPKRARFSATRRPPAGSRKCCPLGAPSGLSRGTLGTLLEPSRAPKKVQ
eukprot:9131340-Pyramimonas_sp.AAC.1